MLHACDIVEYSIVVPILLKKHMVKHIQKEYQWAVQRTGLPRKFTWSNPGLEHGGLSGLVGMNWNEKVNS
jgi:hypothetical protein